MGEFEAYIKSLCLISVFTGLISSAVPSGKFKNAFTGFCSVMLVSAMIIPLKDTGLRFYNTDLFDFSGNEKALSSDVKTAEVLIYQQILSEALEKEIASSFDEEPELSVSCENVNGEVKVISFDVLINANSEQKENIYSYIQEKFPESVITIREAEDE